ncbi:hypothetical protein BN946_scf184817.g20 [Trametes cinnabarina]|uniref:Uncharacterized protein n=1 Tax=Pycnoporus cinnabarinus TaxID=5643 RepID=A0A060S541_PYCCI|nr:hypothetical protein BN946_scf184817.g20 [Trametes cinnabarina]
MLNRTQTFQNTHAHMREPPPAQIELQPVKLAVPLGHHAYPHAQLQQIQPVNQGPPPQSRPPNATDHQRQDDERTLEQFQQPTSQTNPNHPQPPQQSNPPRNQASASQHPMATPEMMEKADMMARDVLEPTRLALCEVMKNTHKHLSEQLAVAHALVAHRTAYALHAGEEVKAARSELARERAAREEAEKRCEKLQADLKQMSEYVPKLIFESMDMRAERDRLGEEVKALREANALLREKAGAGVVKQLSSESFEDDKMMIKEEKPCFEDEPKPGVKNEDGCQRNSSSDVAEHDAAVAQALAQAHEERRQRERAERALAVMKALLTAKALPPPSASSSNLAVSSNAPQTGPAPAPNEPAANAHLEGSKAEESDDTSMQWTDCNAYEPDLIDLTRLALSSLQLPVDHPPPTRGSGELDVQARAPVEAEPQESPTEANRKHTLETGENEAERPTVKRLRTLDVMPGQVEGQAFVEEEQAGTPGSPAAQASVEPSEAPSNVQIMRQDVTMDEVPQSHPAHQRETTTAPPASRPASRLSQPLQPSQPIHTPQPPPQLPQPSRPTSPALLQQQQQEQPVSSAESGRSLALGALSNLGLSLPSTSSAVQLPGLVQQRQQQQQQQQLPTPTSPNPPELPRRLSMRHMQLMARSQKYHGTSPYEISPAAEWDAIAGHYTREHPAAVERLVNMSHDEIRECLQRFKFTAPRPKRSSEPRPG